jgi:hypothetical protein
VQHSLTEQPGGVTEQIVFYVRGGGNPAAMSNVAKPRVSPK